MKMFLKSSSMLILVFAATRAFAGVPCEELKTKIEDGFKAKGVQNYTLTVVGTADTAEGKVIGTCDGGTKKIVYTRDSATLKSVSAEKPSADPAPAKKPAAAK